MAFDLTNLVPIYQSNIDALINQMGKSVTIYYKPTVTEVTDEFYDEIRQEFIKKPVYKGSDAPNIEENTETIIALIKYGPKDYATFGSVLMDAKGILRLKTFMTDVPKLTRAEYIIPSSDDKDIIYSKYRLVREPIPVGLKVNRYAITYWERM